MMTKFKRANGSINRRQILKMLGGSLVVWHTPALSALSGSSSSKVPAKIVWLVLRGALDSLHTVVPTFDPDLAQLRPTLYEGSEKLLPLQQGFALHPALKNLHQWYLAKECSPVVAVSSGYGARSHFDGQDYLESGMPTINFNSGWLARAVNVKQAKGLAIARSTPISLRSAKNINTWYPSKLKNSTDDLIQDLMRLYQDDEELLSNVKSGIEVRDMAGSMVEKSKRARFDDLALACANLMKEDNGVDCAMLELGGWDTHNNQANRLIRKLTELDGGLAKLKQGLGKQWNNTVVIVATEFGRTAKENGTGGTDHGTGSHLFLTGGAIKGGELLGKWPGLKKENLYQQRDLMPTSHSFAWFANILKQHWHFSDEDIAQVFPQVTAYKFPLIKA